MKVSDLINILKEMPEDLPVRVESCMAFLPTTLTLKEQANQWVRRVEKYDTGEPGYEIEGEILLVTGE